MFEMSQVCVLRCHMRFQQHSVVTKKGESARKSCVIVTHCSMKAAISIGRIRRQRCPRQSGRVKVACWKVLLGEMSKASWCLTIAVLPDTKSTFRKHQEAQREFPPAVGRFEPDTFFAGSIFLKILKCAPGAPHQDLVDACTHI